MNREWKAAMEAAASGAGLASGRMIAMFFSQTGWASWLGAAAASVVFGMLCAGAHLLARKAGKTTPADAARRFAGRFAEAMCVLAAIAAGMVMLNQAGRLATLAIFARHAYWMGVVGAAGIGLMLNMRRMRLFSWFGTAAIAVGILFYVSLALDPEPVRFYQRFETVAELSGSISASVMLACMHASLCAVISSGAVMLRVGDVENTFRFAVKCGAIMLLMIASANAAMLRGGEKLLSLAYPEAALAARWGNFGYYFCIFSMNLQTVSTLCACIRILIGANAKDDKIPC